MTAHAEERCHCPVRRAAFIQAPEEMQAAIQASEMPQIKENTYQPVPEIISLDNYRCESITAWFALYCGDVP
jgi:hypothetical protein